MWFRRSKKTKPTEDAKRADHALAEAEAAHRRITRRGDEVSRITTSLREFRERNHITEQLQVIMEGHR